MSFTKIKQEIDHPGSIGDIKIAGWFIG